MFVRKYVVMVVVGCRSWITATNGRHIVGIVAMMHQRDEARRGGGNRKDKTRFEKYLYLPYVEYFPPKTKKCLHDDTLVKYCSYIRVNYGYIQ